MENIKLYEKLESEMFDLRRKITEKAVSIAKKLDLPGYYPFDGGTASFIEKKRETLTLSIEDYSRYSDPGDKDYLIIPLEYFEMSEEELEEEVEKLQREKVEQEKLAQQTAVANRKAVLKLQIEQATKALAALANK